MEEAKTTEKALEKQKQKKTSKAKKNTSFFKGLRSEFRKINWPSLQTLVKQSWTVIVVSAIIGFAVMFIDFVYATGYNMIITG